VLTRHRRSLVLIAAVAAAGVCAPGCRRQGGPPAPMKMRIGIAVPPKASGAPGSGFDAFIRLLTTEPLLTSRPDGRQSERIATDWQWDESGTTLRLTLRRDVYFHDGSRLTPEIAAQTLRLAVENKNRTEPDSFASVSTITPSGADGVEIKLKERNFFLAPDLASVVMAKPDRPDIGTGPFQIVSQDDKSARLSAFPRYFRGRPGLNDIEVIYYPTQRKAWTSLMRDEIDMLHEVSREAAEFVQAETMVKAYPFPRPYYIPLVFNVRHPILKKPEVRKALNEAIDKASLVKEGMNGKGRPADGPVPPEHWAYAPPAEPFVFDPPAARRRLDAAGVTERAPAGRAGGGRFSFKCLIFSQDTRFERLAVLVQKQLADVGVDMVLEPLSLKDLVARFDKGDFDAFIFELAGRSLSRTYEFWRSHPGARFDSGYTAADAVLDSIRGSRRDDEVRAGVARLATILHDDPPAVFLAWQETARAVSTKFDVAPERDRDIIANLWQWRPAAPTAQARR
jgi:peptide/nickel transport system substrate-binding protein